MPPKPNPRGKCVISFENDKKLVTLGSGLSTYTTTIDSCKTKTECEKESKRYKYETSSTDTKKKGIMTWHPYRTEITKKNTCISPDFRKTSGKNCDRVNQYSTDRSTFINECASSDGDVGVDGGTSMQTSKPCREWNTNKCN